MKLDLFQRIADIPEARLHPKFKFLRDNPMLKGERTIIENWTEGFIDRDNKIIKEFQTTFHSSFWEFFLFRIFIDAGFTVDFNHDRPDFIIKTPFEINVEAVVSNIKQNGDGEETRNIDNLLSMIAPPHRQENFDDFLDESIVRNSNAILSKNKKFIESYADCAWVKSETPFIIALSSYDQVDYGREYYYSLIALLYGLYYDPITGKYRFVKSIIKPGTDAPIPVGLFNNSGMEHISAIIFSCTITLGKLTSLSISEDNFPAQMNKVITVRHDYEPPYFKIQEVSKENPEELSDGLFIFHNPFAKNKLSLDLFKGTNMLQVICKGKDLSFIGENSPIVSRLNMPKMMFSNSLIIDIYNNFNES